MAEMKLVPVPVHLLSEAAGLLDCEGYGPIAAQLNAMLAASPQGPAREGADLLDRTPNLGFQTNEPSLREMIDHYYRSHSMPDPMSWSARYVAALTPREEAPAEGAGDDLRSCAHDAAVALESVLSAPEDETRRPHARHYLDRLNAALRARTSEPEAREAWGYAARRTRIDGAPCEASWMTGKVGDGLYMLTSVDPEWEVITLYTHPSPATADKLLDVLRDQSWDLRCFNIPTGGDDFEIGWRVVGHWQGEPCARTIAEVFSDDPADAIRQALATLSPKEEGGE